MAVRNTANGIPSNSAVSIVEEQSTRTLDQEHFATLFSQRCSILLSLLQITSCISAIIVQMTLISNINIILDLWHTTRDELQTNLSIQFQTFRIGAGIWCGVIFGLSGGFGLFASFKPSKCSIVSFLVTTILSVGFSITLIVIASFGTAQRRKKDEDHDGPDYSKPFPHSYGLYGLRSGTTESPAAKKEIQVSANLHSSLVIIGGFMFVVSIISLVISFRAIFCRKKTSQISAVDSPTAAIDNMNGRRALTRSESMMMSPSMTLFGNSSPPPYDLSINSFPPSYEETLREDHQWNTKIRRESRHTVPRLYPDW